jgi:hypothetical protein
MLRPPDAFLSRSVVTRLAPPLALPGFSTKMGFIRENHGMPVDRRVSEKLSVDHFKGARPIADVRPASGIGGKVDFAPKRDLGSKNKVQPMSMTQGQGHTLATRDKPLGIQSKNLQSYQRPFVDTRAQQGAKTFGQGKAQTQGQQTQPQGQVNTGRRNESQGIGQQGTTRSSGQSQQVQRPIDRSAERPVVRQPAQQPVVRQPVRQAPPPVVRHAPPPAPPRQAPPPKAPPKTDKKPVG